MTWDRWDRVISWLEHRGVYVLVGAMAVLIALGGPREPAPTITPVERATGGAR